MCNKRVAEYREACLDAGELMCTSTTTISGCNLLVEDFALIQFGCLPRECSQKIDDLLDRYNDVLFPNLKCAVVG
eukprot:TRINITY_DN12478_c0_g1_i1.p1 TRINITY_DN12478_c0_g1~~TRINITY_DN12478_c0_g1_i1.p1  ORF type:complete len:75 (+),score=8.91 TRINITY_DN12478_c0_g1_i1:259-483(+)